MSILESIPDVLAGDSPAQQRIDQARQEGGVLGGLAKTATELPALAGDVLGTAKNYTPLVGDAAALGLATTEGLSTRQRVAIGLGALVGVSTAARYHHLRRQGMTNRQIFWPGDEEGSFALPAGRVRPGPFLDLPAYGNPRYRVGSPRAAIIHDAPDTLALADYFRSVPDSQYTPTQRGALAGFLRTWGQRLTEQVGVHQEERGRYTNPDDPMLGSLSWELAKFDEALQRGIFVGPAADSVGLWNELRQNPAKFQQDGAKTESLLRFLVDFSRATEGVKTPELGVAPHMRVAGITAGPDGLRTAYRYSAEALPTRLNDEQIFDRINRLDYEELVPWMVQNTLRMKNHFATPEQIQDGMEWYPRAHALAKDYAQTYSVTEAQAAGVLSIFSASTAWPDTVRYADRFLAASGDETQLAKEKISTWKLRAVANRILETDGSYEAVRAAFKRDKTGNFFENIYDPTRFEPNTVDTHDFELKVGFRTSHPKPPQFEQSRVYRAMADANRIAAQIEGLAAANKIQAIAWTPWQQLKLGAGRPLDPLHPGELPTPQGRAGKASGRFVLFNEVWDLIHGRSSPTLAEVTPLVNSGEDVVPFDFGDLPKGKRKHDPKRPVLLVDEPDGSVSILAEPSNVIKESVGAYYPLGVHLQPQFGDILRWVPSRARLVDDIDPLLEHLRGDPASPTFSVIERHVDPSFDPLVRRPGLLVQVDAEQQYLLDALDGELQMPSQRIRGIQRMEPELHRNPDVSDLSPDNFQQRLESEQWVALTAENPHGEATDPRSNAAANAHLKRAIRNMGYDPVAVQGFYGGNDENSFLVFGMTNREAMKLGTKYGQESVVSPMGLLYTTGEDAGMMNPAQGGITFDNELFENYSMVQFGRQKIRFSQGLDFEQLIPIGEPNASLLPTAQRQRVGAFFELGTNPDQQVVTQLWSVVQRMAQDAETPVDPVLYLHGSGASPEDSVRVVERHYTDANGKGSVVHRNVDTNLADEHSLYGWVPSKEGNRYQPAAESTGLHYQEAAGPRGDYVVNDEVRLFVPEVAVLNTRNVLASKVEGSPVRHFAVYVPQDGLPALVLGKDTEAVRTMMQRAGAVDPSRVVEGRISGVKGQRSLSLDVTSHRRGIEADALLRRLGVDVPAGNVELNVTTGTQAAQ